MDKDKEERKRSHLRLVVDNEEKRSVRPPGSEGTIVPFEELAARREEMTPLFYSDLSDRQAQAYQALEQYFNRKSWPYALDPQQGKIVVLPVSNIAPEIVENGGSSLDEALVMVSGDGTKTGYCLTLETILPFYSEDEGVMEEALIYGPILPYGALFLEENQQDGLLDLIYRLAFPLFPPSPAARLIERFFTVAAAELKETMREPAVDES